MVESSCSLTLLNKPSRNSRLPPTLENLAPSLLNLLEKEQIRSEPELFLKSIEILYALLSSAEPGLVRDFMRAEGRRFMDLNHTDLPEKVFFKPPPPLPECVRDATPFLIFTVLLADLKGVTCHIW